MPPGRRGLGGFPRGETELFMWLAWTDGRIGFITSAAMSLLVDDAELAGAGRPAFGRGDTLKPEPRLAPPGHR